LPVRLGLRRSGKRYIGACPACGYANSFAVRDGADHPLVFCHACQDTDAGGSGSPDFVNATLFQLQAAARLPNSGLSEIVVNAALALIEHEKPQGETECAIVVRMACVHAATMAVLGRLGGGHGGDRHVLAAATAASRLSRTFAILVETLRRLRSGGSQIIRIERVEVKDGGQAVIGNFKTNRSEPNE
jgi:hypothetical protein